MRLKMETLKVVTLNCCDGKIQHYGIQFPFISGTFEGIPIPGISKMRAQRMEAIGQELSKGDYHIVVLEEIWSKGDFDFLSEYICQALPYSHYFHSGAIGSGVCVFSKIRITETFYHRFHLNGHAYKVQHGDWFGGKGVGLCKLEFLGFKVNLYVTHIHAEYNRADDEYLPHRLSQAFEMSQFIRLTSAECDVVVAAGDFNLESSDVGYKLLTSNTPLYDAWEHKKNIPESNKVGATCECPWNLFRDKAFAKECPEGKRIDYIMYCAHPRAHVTVEKCYTTLGQVPGKNFPFSDHEAVAAELRISKNTTGESSSSQQHHREENNETYLRAAREVVQKGAEGVQSSMGRFQLQAVGLAVLLYWLCYTDMTSANPYPIHLLLSVAKVVLVLAVAALIWLSLIVKRGEMQGLVATGLDMDRVIAQKAKSR